MRTGLLLGAVLLAGLGVAGGAAAHDDCQTAPVPGFYARICLLDDHVGSPWSWNTPAMVSTSGTGPYPGHDICQYAPGPGLYARLCVDQSSYRAMSCSGGTCTGYQAAWTATHAQAGGPFGDVHADALQSSGEQSAGWGVQRSELTEVSARASPAGQPVTAEFQQYTQDGTSGSSCENYVFIWSAAFSRFVARPCAEPTPVGAVDTHVPMLHKTCVATPAGAVCGTFPDWPDDTGLPFL